MNGKGNITRKNVHHVEAGLCAFREEYFKEVD